MLSQDVIGGWIKFCVGSFLIRRYCNIQAIKATAYQYRTSTVQPNANGDSIRFWLKDSFVRFDWTNTFQILSQWVDKDDWFRKQAITMLSILGLEHNCLNDYSSLRGTRKTFKNIQDVIYCSLIQRKLLMRYWWKSSSCKRSLLLIQDFPSSALYPRWWVRFQAWHSPMDHPILVHVPVWSWHLQGKKVRICHRHQDGFNREFTGVSKTNDEPCGKRTRETLYIPTLGYCNLPYRPVSSLRSPRTISCVNMWAASSRPFTNSSKTGPELGAKRLASIWARSCIRDSFIAWSSPRNSWIRARLRRRKPATVWSLEKIILMCNNS